MRTLLGEEPGEGGLADEPDVMRPDGTAPDGDADAPSLDDLESRPTPERPPGAGSASPSGNRQRHLPSIAPDPQPGH